MGHHRRAGSSDTPKSSVLVDQDVGGSFSRAFLGRDGVHVCVSADPVREKQNVYAFLRCEEDGGNVVDADNDTGPGRKGVREDGPRHCPS